MSLLFRNLDPILNSIFSDDPLQLPYPSIPLRNNPLLPSFSAVIPDHPIIEEGPTIRMNIGKRKIPPKPPPTKGNVALRFNGIIQEQINKDHPDSNLVFVVGKVAGAKWKSLSEVEKAPCVAMDNKRKANYEKWIRDDHHRTEEYKMATGPIQRFIIVAIIGVAFAESKKNRIIWQLTKSMELRDQVLSSMQQKLDIFCEEVNNVRDHSGALGKMAATINAEFSCNKAFGFESIKFVDCGCWLYDQHCDIYNTWSGCMKSSSGDRMPKYKLAFSNEIEPEGRMPKLFDEMLDGSVWVASEIKARSDECGKFMDFLPGRIYSSKHGGLRKWYNPVLGVKEELNNYSDEDYLVRPIAIFVAYKYEEIFVPFVENLVLISDKAYTREEVIDIEKVMGSWNAIVLTDEQGPQRKAKGVAIGLPLLIILVIFSQYMPHLMRGEIHVFNRFVVIFLVGIVWMYAHLLNVGGAYKNIGPKTQISCKNIHSRTWIRVPYPSPWGATTFDAGEAYALMAASFVTIVEPIGTFFALPRYASATSLPPFLFPAVVLVGRE
ncbi:hypothetical protein F2P56_024397 [Juglans regia]|uniref:B-like cyclin n=1 Tax=Juglans regia TaxID=51240 RepID=A0A833UGY8_JUGRE|nr:hypothetical protein F2P56_024397 [Juglans regia]